VEQKAPRKVERIAPYAQGEALALSQGPYTFALHRIWRSHGGEVWSLYDATKRPNDWAGTISVVYGEGGVLNTGIEGGVDPILQGARAVVTLIDAVEPAATREYLARLFLLLGINGGEGVETYDSARFLGVVSL
jgi:hypothetical protein